MTETAVALLDDADYVIRAAHRTIAARRPRNRYERERAERVKAYAAELSDWCSAADWAPNAEREVRHWTGVLRDAIQMLRFTRKVDMGAMLREGRSHPATAELEALARANAMARRQLLNVWSGVDHPLVVKPSRQRTLKPQMPTRARRRERSGTARRRATWSSSRSGDSGDDDPAGPPEAAERLRKGSGRGRAVAPAYGAGNRFPLDARSAPWSA